MIFSHSYSHTYSFVYASGVSEKIYLYNLICGLSNLSFSVKIKATAKDKEFFVESNSRVTLSWLNLIQWIVNLSFLPANGARF